MTELFTLLAIILFAAWVLAIWRDDKAERKRKLYRRAEIIGRYRVGRE